MKVSRELSVWVLLILGISLAFWFVVGSQSFQSCIYQTENNQASQTAQESKTYIPVVIGNYAGCLGQFLDAHEGALTALSTLLIAIFTLTLWLSTSRMAQLTDETIRLAREEFISTHRPKLIVRMVYFDGEDRSVKYEVANIGGVDGTLTTAHGAIHFEFLPHQVSYNSTPNIYPIVIPAGMHHEFTQSIGNKVTELFDHATVDGVEMIAYFIGCIYYTGPLGAPRRTAFCRRYNTEKQRFTLMDDVDPDYEHAD